MEYYKAQFLLDFDKLGKRKKDFKIPLDLEKLNVNRKNKAIIGIGKWNGNKQDSFVAIYQGKEIIYIGKKVLREIAKSIK